MKYQLQLNKKSILPTFKAIIILLIGIFGSDYTMAQIPQFSWAHSIGGTLSDNSRDVTTDLDGNVLIAGIFNNTNPGSLVIKYDASGNFLWSGNTLAGIAIPTTISTDGSNNVIVCGTFSSDSVVFGNFTIYRTASSGPAFPDIFTVKYDDSGNVIWANGVGGTGAEIGGVSTDFAGNSYVVFNSQSSSVTIGGTTYINTAASSNDSFILKYDPAGNLMWVKQIGGPSSSDVYDITTDNNGNTYIGGTFCVSCTITIDTLTLSGETYLIKFDSFGSVVWAKTGSGGSVWGMYADDNGSFSMIGNYYGDTITFGAVTFLNPNPGIGSNGFYTAKFDTSGNAIWIKGDGANSNVNGICTTIDNAGNVYALGVYSNTTITIGTNTYNNQGINSDVFIVKYDNSGNIIWSDAFGSSNEDYFTGICIGPGGDVFVTGYFKGPTLNLGGIPLSNNGSNTTDGFIGAISSSTGLLSQVNSNTSQLIVYPNPVHETLTTLVQSPFLYSEYFLLDGVGKIVLAGKANSEQTTIDMKPLSPGIYFLKTTSLKGSNVIKVVKD